MASEDGPAIPGWDVSQDDQGRWLARRRGGLSALHMQYGCRLLVGADSFGELELHVCAENIKATVVAAAEDLARRMAEADFKRQAADEGQGADGGAVEG